MTANATSTEDGCAGIWVAENGSLTLGWTDATDSIAASSYSLDTGSTTSIADGQCMVDEGGHTHIGAIASADDGTGADLAGLTLTRSNLKIVAEHGSIVP
ncbi:MAG: hypothetical protein Q4A07_04430, partial [Coriobacteriales bacterium]|nr:hypothetical protein [Coriobacteriales bacterium]